MHNHGSKRRRPHDRRQSGAAAVEAAVVLPLVMLLLFGIIEYGFVFNRWTTTTHAAREGVRVYSITGDQAEAEQAAEDAAPDLGSTITCTGSEPAPGEVQMYCTTTHALKLYVFKDDVVVGSTARMRKE